MRRALFILVCVAAVAASGCGGNDFHKSQEYKDGRTAGYDLAQRADDGYLSPASIRNSCISAYPHWGADLNWKEERGWEAGCSDYAAGVSP